MSKYIQSSIRVGTAKNGHALIEIQCICGNKKVVRKDHVASGLTQSCGCLRIERVKITSTKHGHNRNTTVGKTITYNSWQNMRKRCLNDKSIQYKDYGGRGIKICKEWDKFENFLKDMGERPSKRHSIDRINVNGNYCKSNCKWSDYKEQAKNKRIKQ